MQGHGDCNEIIWISTKPKCLPRPYTNLIIYSFHRSPGQNACSCRNFHVILQANLHFVRTKYTYASIFIAGDTNDISHVLICRV